MATSFYIGNGLFKLRGGKHFELGGRDRVPGHKCLGKGLGALHPGSKCAGTKNRDSDLMKGQYRCTLDAHNRPQTFPKVGFDTIDEWLFRARNDEIKLLDGV
jgi:hypothetical protein